MRSYHVLYFTDIGPAWPTRSTYVLHTLSSAVSREAVIFLLLITPALTDASSISGEDGQGLYLVNFDQKARDDRRSVSPSSETEEQKETIDTTADDDNEIVEYVDSFGRTRKCHKNDLEVGNNWI